MVKKLVTVVFSVNTSFRFSGIKKKIKFKRIVFGYFFDQNFFLIKHFLSNLFCLINSFYIKFIFQLNFCLTQICLPIFYPSCFELSYGQFPGLLYISFWHFLVGLVRVLVVVLVLVTGKNKVNF